MKRFEDFNWEFDEEEFNDSDWKFVKVADGGWLYIMTEVVNSMTVILYNNWRYTHSGAL